MDNRHLYVGDMSAYMFNTFIGNFPLETWAASEKEARSNFAYQIKKKCNLLPSAKVTVDGVIKIKV